MHYATIYASSQTCSVHCLALDQVLWSCFNASCFGMSHAVLAVHFAYRYIQICQYHRGYLLTGSYQLIWGSYMLLCFGVWMVATVTCLSPTIDKDLQVFPDVLKAYGFSMENRGYMGPQYWVHRGNKLELQFKDCFGMFSVCSMTGTAIIMMCFCGYKTYNGMCNVVASAKTRRLQKQLFYSLVTLTAIPLAFIYGPLVMCFLGPIVGLGMGRFGIVYHWLLTIPPFFDPIVLIYFIGDYRRAALGILGRLDCCSVFPQIWRLSLVSVLPFNTVYVPIYIVVYREQRLSNCRKGSFKGSTEPKTKSKSSEKVEAVVGEPSTSSTYKTSTRNNSTQQTRPSSEANRSQND